jgi:hypothetical protein
MAEFKSTAPLREYVARSELRVVSDDFRVCLSPELAKKYDNGAYDARMKEHRTCIEEIKALGIRYPAGAKPIFYLYIVPKGAGQLLLMPAGMTAGGRSAPCFFPDGFPYAYGETEVILLGKGTSLKIGSIHEWAHVVCSLFYSGESAWLSEGIAELFPYYLLNYEGRDAEHLDLIKNLKEHEILNAQTLLTEFYDHVDFSKRCQLANSYCSAYLFVRGIVRFIEKKENCDKITAVQKLMLAARGSAFRNEFFVYDIADFIGISWDELLYGKSLQLSARADIAKIVPLDKKVLAQSDIKLKDRG